VEPGGTDEALLEFQRPVATGGVVVLFEEGATPADQSGVLESNGFRARAAKDTDGLVSLATEPALSEDAFLIEEFGVAIIAPEKSGTPSERALALGEREGVTFTRPEFYYFPIAPTWHDTSVRTWGIEAVGATSSGFSGDGVRVAILDTGLDFGHPDWSTRTVVAQSFVPGESADDVQGHGTHCAGTAVGHATSGTPRFGVAPAAELYVAKVLSNQGSGTDRGILAGIRWALANECAVISMSLGASVRPGETHDPIYERIAARALASGSLIIAAAGNESRRQLGYIAPVGRPANSPSILAVGAIDQNGDVAYFSCGDVNGDGGVVALAAPGVDVFSSVPGPRAHQSLSGTSMACPHVAGVAALWAQSDPSLRGQALWDKLTTSTSALAHPASDVGDGLVQSP
jgi:hypothetical protein